MTDTFVMQVAEKNLSTNDFTNDYKTALDGLSSMSIDFNPDTLTDTFVQKVTGKDLSTNDFTNADKTRGCW